MLIVDTGPLVAYLNRNDPDHVRCAELLESCTDDLGIDAAAMNTEYTFDTRHDRYPVAAHLILRDPARKILLMRRAGTEYGEGHLAFPAGNVDLGETPPPASSARPPRNSASPSPRLPLPRPG